EPLSNVIYCARADPADAGLDGMQNGQEQGAPRPHLISPKSRPAVQIDLPFAAFPTGLGLAQLPIHGGPLFQGRLVAGEMNIQLVLLMVSPRQRFTLD